MSDKDLLVQVTEDQILWIEDLLESKSQNGGKVWNYRLERLYDTVHGKYLHLVDPKAETEGNGKFKFEALVSVIPEL